MKWLFYIILENVLVSQRLTLSDLARLAAKACCYSLPCQSNAYTWLITGEHMVNYCMPMPEGTRAFTIKALMQWNRYQRDPRAISTALRRT